MALTVAAIHFWGPEQSCRQRKSRAKVREKRTSVGGQRDAELGEAQEEDRAEREREREACGEYYYRCCTVSAVWEKRCRQPSDIFQLILVEKALIVQFTFPGCLLCRLYLSQLICVDGDKKKPDRTKLQVCSERLLDKKIKVCQTFHLNKGIQFLEIIKQRNSMVVDCSHSHGMVFSLTQ